MQELLKIILASTPLSVTIASILLFSIFTLSISYLKFSFNFKSAITTLTEQIESLKINQGDIKNYFTDQIDVLRMSQYELKGEFKADIQRLHLDFMEIKKQYKEEIHETKKDLSIRIDRLENTQDGYNEKITILYGDYLSRKEGKENG